MYILAMTLCKREGGRESYIHLGHDTQQERARVVYILAMTLCVKEREERRVVYSMGTEGRRYRQTVW